MELNLQYFAGGHSVTLYKDSHVTTFTASADSDVQKNATVTLTLTPSSGYEIASVEVLQGGVTVYQDDSTISFTMGESNVVIAVKSQKNNVYKVTETTYVWYNGTGTTLKKNMFLEYGKNGEITGIRCSGSEVSINADIIAQLVKDGVLVKM